MKIKYLWWWLERQFLSRAELRARITVYNAHQALIRKALLAH